MRRVLVDEYLPVQLHRWLEACEVRTVAFMGWKGRRNSELLATVSHEPQQHFSVRADASRSPQLVRGPTYERVASLGSNRNGSDATILTSAMRGWPGLSMAFHSFGTTIEGAIRTRASARSSQASPVR